MSISKTYSVLLSLVLINSYLPEAVYPASEKTVSVPIVEEKIGEKTYQVSRVLVHVKPEHVWRILTDYENAPDIFPCLKKCKLVKDKGTSKLVEHEIKPSGVPGSFNYTLEVKEVVNKLYEWHRVKGDFREVDGFWKLEAMNEGQSTMVTYASYVNGGIFMPPPLIKRQVRMDIPPVMTALKSHAETSRAIAGVGQKGGNN